MISGQEHLSLVPCWWWTTFQSNGKNKLMTRPKNWIWPRLLLQSRIERLILEVCFTGRKYVCSILNLCAETFVDIEFWQEHCPVQPSLKESWLMKKLLKIINNIDKEKKRCYHTETVKRIDFDRMLATEFLRDWKRIRVLNHIPELPRYRRDVVVKTYERI